MTRRYLLDTNIASYIIKGNIPAVRHRLVKVPMAQVAVSAVTEGELRYGLAPRPEAVHLRRVVDEFLLRLTILPWDSEAAQAYGQLRGDARTRRTGDGQPRHDDRRTGLGVRPRAGHE